MYVDYWEFWCDLLKELKEQRVRTVLPNFKIRHAEPVSLARQSLRSFAT